MQPAMPKAMTRTPGNRTSFHVGRCRSSHACANAGLAREALQVADKRTACPSVRRKPVVCGNTAYGATAGATSAIDTHAAVATATQYAPLAHNRRVAAKTTVAKPTIRIANTP